VDDADEALGHPGAHEGALDPSPYERRPGRRLEHHPVAGHQGDRRLQERPEPGGPGGGDHPDDPEWLPYVPMALAEQPQLAGTDALVAQ
jgi:hypothetical protein